LYKKYIIIGALPSENAKSHGGTTILVKQLVDYCKEKKIEFILLETNKYSGRYSFIKNYFFVLKEYCKNLRNVEIIFSNVASNGMYFLAPLLLLISKIYKKKFISRIFGGNSIELYNTGNKFKNFLIHYLFEHSDILFFETKYLVNYFLPINKATYWFPNTRKKPNTKRDTTRPYKHKFIYIGQIKEEKGISELVEAFRKLNNKYTLELYGNIVEEKYLFLKTEQENIKYKGEIDHSMVNTVLSGNDILILPSYREGYPGVIIEAFGVGLPTIATNLPSIAEMFEKKSGILVKVQNVDSLINAIKSINGDTYNFYSLNSLKESEKYNYENVYKSVFNICEGRI